MTNLLICHDCYECKFLQLVYGFSISVFQVLKSVVAKFNASQLITMRQQVSLMIRNDLVERARDFHIILDDVSITDLTFSKEYAAAVESKQVNVVASFLTL